jgi:predicted HicB family RNase H-like nuclease
MTQPSCARPPLTWRYPVANKKPSGVNIPEAQRHTTRVMLRLRPDIAERLRAAAEQAGQSVSAYVAGLVA